jgi:hypothetical protein
MKRIVFWAFTILIPFILFLLLELVLRVSGYNEDAQDLFVEVAIKPEYVAVNPSFVSRYFPSFTPDIAKSPFLKQKKDNTFRVFVLGGSSTQGYPYNFYSSFSTQLEQRLSMETLGLHIEVINLGMTAVNSFVLWDLSKRIMKYDPDAVLIYAGHNEYYGSFGAGSTQFGFWGGVGMKRLVLNLKNWRVYQFFEDVIRSEVNENPNNRTLMARVVKDSGIPINSKTYTAGINQFEENLSDILEYFNNETVPAYIGTVASNIKDQEPLGNGEEALKSFEKGNSYFEAGKIDSARLAYLVAKERDEIRFRAPQVINEVIKKTAKKYDAYLVDINNASAQASESSIQDKSFFVDHLHPDWEGHQLIAHLYFNELRDNVHVLSEAYSTNPLFGKITISEFEEVYSGVQIKRLTAGYPFQKGLSGKQEYANFQRDYETYLNGSYVDSIAASAWRMQRDEPLALTDVINYSNSKTDSLSVLKHYQQLAYWQIFNTELLKKGVKYAINNRRYDLYSARILHIILSIEREDPYFANTLAALYLIHNDLKRSEYWLEKVKELDEESVLLWYSYARLYALKGDTAKARNALDKFTRLRNAR